MLIQCNAQGHAGIVDVNGVGGVIEVEEREITDRKGEYPRLVNDDGKGRVNKGRHRRVKLKGGIEHLDRPRHRGGGRGGISTWGSDGAIAWGGGRAIAWGGGGAITWGSRGGRELRDRIEVALSSIAINQQARWIVEDLTTV